MDDRLPGEGAAGGDGEGQGPGEGEEERPELPHGLSPPFKGSIPAGGQKRKTPAGPQAHRGRGDKGGLQLVEGQGEFPDLWEHLRAEGFLGGEPQDRQRVPEGALLCFVLK